MTNEKEISNSGLRIFWRKPAAALYVTGADSFSFLQGQLTNDLRGSDSGDAVYGLWLDHKGRVHGDGFVVRESGEAYWVYSERTAAAALRTRLEGFVIADDVTINDRTAEWEAVTVAGAPQPSTGGPKPDGLLPLRRVGASSWTTWVYPATAAEAVRAHWQGAQEVTEVEIERWRILAGVPAIPSDIGPGELPQEGGLESVAISYSKGCYLGQEVMARLKSMGQVRRELIRVRGATAPAPATPLFQGERRVGEMKTAAADRDGFIGFALLTTLALQRELPLSEKSNEPGRITVCR